MSRRRPNPIPALLAPYCALALTAVLADGAPLACALPLYAGLSMAALCVLSAVWAGKQHVG